MRAKSPPSWRYMEARITASGNTVIVEAMHSMRASPGKTLTHFEQIAQAAARSLGVSNVCLHFLDLEDSKEACVGPGSDVLTPFCRKLAEEVAAEATAIMSPDCRSSASGDGASTASYVALPICADREIRGALCVFDFTARTFTDDDLDLIQHFVDLAASELRREMEVQLLRNSEERFRTVTESAQDVIAILDRDARFSYVSPSAHSIFGSQPTRLIGTTIYDCVHGDDLDGFRDALEAQISRPTLENKRFSTNGSVRTSSPTSNSSFAQDGILDIEFRTVFPDGVRHLRLLGNNLFNRKGVDGYLIHVRDVTDRATFDAEVLKSRDRAEEMSRLKSVFLTNMSHEIRTPLTTILGFAEILADEVDEDSLEFVHLIQQGGERLLDTLMSILDLARLESSSFDIIPEPFDVAAKIEEICRLIGPLADEKKLSLTFEQEGIAIEAVLDISAVERVVSNLVSNGIKFTKEGGVTVSLEADEDHLLIHVADTGIGIGEEFMPFLFEDFKQESEGLSRIHEGSGLGLSITKRLVQLMKGNIMAESDKGRGTVFTVALPRNGEASATESESAAAEEKSRRRVLVVEDNADTRTLVNHLLRKSYDVRCASDADDAIELAAAERYDVLLVDINLGKGKSGEDVLHAIKSLPSYSDTPVIAVTAYAMPGDRERFFNEGFDDYVSKPFSKQRLLEALEGVLA